MRTNQNLIWPLAVAASAAIVIGCGGGSGAGLSTSGGATGGFTGGTISGPNARGVATSVDSSAGKFVLSVSSGTGVSAGASLTIVTTASTQFFASSGQPIAKVQFFGVLPTAKNVQIEGELSVSQGQLTATKLKLEDESSGTSGGSSGSTSAGGGGSSGGAEATGSASNIGANSFAVTLSSWEGFSASAGSTLNVQTTSATEFKLNGQTVAANAFFAALSIASSVSVEGSFANGVLTASEVKIGGSSGGSTGGSAGGGSDDTGGTSSGTSGSTNSGGSDDTGGSSSGSSGLTSSGGSDDTGGHD